MRLPVTRFGFSTERRRGRTRPPATMPRHLDAQLLVSNDTCEVSDDTYQVSCDSYHVVDDACDVSGPDTYQKMIPIRYHAILTT
ncbi:Os11g0195950 [Oryza sativa Japonica Group]|uniref:Os11g0195950 protein n=1 Tax=Oryza sativa subsp. japonica TaxID=39947 RepID=A0A0P0XZL6_ORYSJ|nr:Os11g0195950 [Oryza sativa Japonica Group]